MLIIAARPNRRSLRAPRLLASWEDQAGLSHSSAELRAQMYPFLHVFHIYHLQPVQINHLTKQARVPSAARMHKLKAWNLDGNRGAGSVCISPDVRTQRPAAALGST